MPNASPTYRPDIDGLRGVAIIFVVAYHAFPKYISGGFIGVDIFFVISGFLISTIIFKSLNAGHLEFSDFYARRIRRIFPALILILTTSFAIGWFALLPEEYMQLGWHIAASAGFIQNFNLLSEAGYFDTASGLKPLMHLWSLSIEEQFYLFFPAVISLAFRQGLRPFHLIAAMCLTSFCINLLTIQENSAQVFFMPYTRIWELLAGAALACIQSSGGKASIRNNSNLLITNKIFSDIERIAFVRRNLLSMCGLMLIVLTAFALTSRNLYPGGWALIPVVGTGLLIWAGPKAWLNRKILAHRVMVFIGVISYPLYLWHWLLLSLARIVETETPRLSIRITIVALSILLAWLTYRLVELPIRNGKHPRVITASLCLLIVLVGYAGSYVFQRDGLDFRHRHFLTNLNELKKWSAEKDLTEGCQQAFPSLHNSYCSISKTGEPTVLIVGDSHANHFYPGLAKELPSETIINIGHGGCIPFFGVESKQIGTKGVCNELMSRLLHFAESSKSINTVILAFRGPWYLPGTGYSETEINVNTILTLMDNKEISDKTKIFIAGLKATLNRLTSNNKQVIIALSIPELDFDVSNCITNRPITISDHPIRQVCAITKKAFEERSAEYRSAVATVLEDFPTVRLFDAAASFCDSDYCWAKRDGKLLYRDRNHLSVQGSQFVGRDLATFLLDAQNK